MSPAEKSEGSALRRRRKCISLQSGLPRRNLRNTGIYANFNGQDAGNSLQSRLRGGEERIRTLGTGLKPVRADLCVSYTDSIVSIILCDCLLAVESSLTHGVSGGVRRRILGDSVEKELPSKFLKRPGWVGMCLPSGQSRGRNFLETIDSRRGFQITFSTFLLTLSRLS